MARGPRPKDPAVRQRRNRAATAAELQVDIAAQLQAKRPPLTAHLLGIKGPVRAQVQNWWREIWASPMAPRWLKSDVPGLYMIARLHHEFWTKPSSTLAGEIRQQEGRFGLDVISRRRLDWRIEGPRRPDSPAPAPEPEPEPQDDEDDPRQILRVVQ